MRHPKARWAGVGVMMKANKLVEVLREPEKFSYEKPWRFKER